MLQKGGGNTSGFFPRQSGNTLSNIDIVGHHGQDSTLSREGVRISFPPCLLLPYSTGEMVFFGPESSKITFGRSETNVFLSHK